MNVVNILVISIGIVVLGRFVLDVMRPLRRSSLWAAAPAVRDDAAADAAGGRPRTVSTSAVRPSVTPDSMFVVTVDDGPLAA